jgi:hypothetical protein
VTLFADNILGKYQPPQLDMTIRGLLSTVKPFSGDLYDVLLRVVYQEGADIKTMLFLPDAPMQKVSLQNLKNRGRDALPISALASFVPNANCGKKILKSQLVVRIGTHELIPGMVSSFSQSCERAGLEVVAQFSGTSSGDITLATMRTGPFMASDKAQHVISALNNARTMLRGVANEQKIAFDFRTLRLLAVDPAVGVKGGKPILSGELR